MTNDCGSIDISKAKIPVWVVRAGGGGNRCVFDSLEAAEKEAAFLREEDPDDLVSIETKEMTVKEYQTLPEFEGY